jgi:general secretion pathway protein C
METFLRRYFFTVHLGALLGTTFLLGAAANHLLEGGLLSRLLLHAGRALAPAPAAKRRARSDGSAITARNLFCSTCDGRGQPPPPAGTMPTSPLPLELVATVLLDDVPGDSYAVLREARGGAIMLHRVTSVLDPDELARLARVEPSRVLISRGGRLEMLELGLSARPGADPALARRPSPAEDATARLSRGIRRLSATRFEVERGVIERLLADPLALSSSARVLPASHGRGFRIYGTRPGGLWGQLGVENGDTVVAVNGQRLGSLDEVLALSRQVRSASHVTVGVDRRGQPVNLDYAIR